MLPLPPLGKLFRPAAVGYGHALVAVSLLPPWIVMVRGPFSPHTGAKRKGQAHTWPPKHEVSALTFSRGPIVVRRLPRRAAHFIFSKSNRKLPLGKTIAVAGDRHLASAPALVGKGAPASARPVAQSPTVFDHLGFHHPLGLGAPTPALSPGRPRYPPAPPPPRSTDFSCPRHCRLVPIEALTRTLAPVPHSPGPPHSPAGPFPSPA